MLITDESKGAADGKEYDELQAMVAVGSEFITYKDHESTIQKSGEFVRITKEPGDTLPRFALLHETTSVFDEAWRAVPGYELRAAAGSPTPLKLRKRSRLYVSETDTTNGDLPFREINGYKTQTRIPRHHGYIEEGRHPSSLNAMREVAYTMQAGKRRLFSTGDGKLVLVREVHNPGDPRHFNDSIGKPEATPQPHTKRSGLRAARVEVVELNPTNGKDATKPLFSFDVYSGLDFQPSPKNLSDSIRLTADMYSGAIGDSGTVYAAFSGVLYGSSMSVIDHLVPAGGDASDTYAVAEPSRTKHPDGREYTSIIAVFPAPDDVYDSRGSGPYRLTCKRTTPGGGVALNKIAFPPLPHLPKHYLAARGMCLYRLSPTRVVLNVLVHAMQFGADGTVQASAGDSFFMWSDNNGESWTYSPVTPGWVGIGPYGGTLVKDANSLIAFSWWKNYGAEQIEVHRVTSTGTTKIAAIAGATFSSGLMQSGTWEKQIPYTPTGFGGAVYRKTTTGKKKRLWMQFDPDWYYAQEETYVLNYPGSRPLLMVSDNNGLTWTRRFLPSVWAFRVGFVVSVDESTLAVPIYSARKARGKSIVATIYTSKDGGDTWKASGAQIALHGETHVDGQIVIGAQYQNSRDEWKYEQDLNSSATEFNRGELLPMVALRDADGEVLPANPARPWMNDYKIGVPEYAEQT